jgi:hypothetical protein
MLTDLAPGEHPVGLGAHALGALGPAEAAAVREHTAHCRDCRQELDEFAEVTDMLDQVPLAALLDSSPDGGTLLAGRTIARTSGCCPPTRRLTSRSSSSTGTGAVATRLSQCWRELVTQAAHAVVQAGLDRPG